MSVIAQTDQVYCLASSVTRLKKIAKAMPHTQGTPLKHTMSINTETIEN